MAAPVWGGHYKWCVWIVLPSEERIVLHHLVDLVADGVDLGFRSGLGLRIDVADDIVNQVDDDGHLVLLQTTGGDGRRANTQT